MSEKSEKPIHFAGVNLGRHRHVCAFFENQDQEDKVIIPFLKEGIDRGERVFCISATERRTHVLQKLQQAGTDVATAEKRGQLQIEQWVSTVLGTESFDTEAMAARIESILNEGRKQGFSRTRLVGRMEWVREYNMGISELVRYENKLNSVLKNVDDPVICSYDLSEFNAGALVDVLRIHPITILGDVVAKNPFFDTPEAVLEELSRRDNEVNGGMEG